MSIQSEITRISGNVSDALGAVAAKGVTVPAGSTSDDLADLISQIQQGGGSGVVVTETADVSGGIIKEITAVDLSGDTVDAAHLLNGYTAHDRLGNAITGTYAGGTSAWTLLKSQESEISMTSTSASTAVTISCGAEAFTASKIVWVHIRDKAGPRAGYFYGSDAFFVNFIAANASTTTIIVPAVLCLRYNNGTYSGTAGQYGVYGYSISSTGSLIVRKRYNSSNSLTINGTYKIDVYTLDLPSGETLFG